MNTQERTRDKASEWLSDSCLITNYKLIGNDHFIGTYRVMFGMRVRGGRLFNGGCDLDVCCGDSQTVLKLVMDIYEVKALKNIKENKRPFDGLKTMSEIKPVFNDIDYMCWLAELVEELEPK